MKFNSEILKSYQEQGLITMRKHPEAGLYIVNYTPKVQYDRLWDEITMKTRGLIIDSEGNVVARPFGKFFNFEEHQPSEIPQLPFEVFEKVDGSLGILFWLNDKPFIATRGSFESDQSKHATEVLYSRYHHTFERLDKSATYLFEIIYPENRIVIDYGDMDDLILLTVIDNETGSERIDDIGFPMVKRFDGINDLTKLRAVEENNKEGFVVRFNNGFRVKMKFAEYVRLHRIITGVSNIAIWEYLADGKSMQELLEKVPDEFYTWVKQTQTELISKFDEIYEASKAAYAECYSEDKKTFALAAIGKYKKLSSVLFCIYNNKDYIKLIWKMCRPTFSKPFKTEQP
jgi:RNA ligase